MKKVLITLTGLAVTGLVRNLDLAEGLLGSSCEVSIDASLEISSYALVDSLTETSSASSSASSSEATQRRRDRRNQSAGVGPGNQFTPTDYSDIPRSDRPYSSGPTGYNSPPPPPESKPGGFDDLPPDNQSGGNWPDPNGKDKPAT